MSPVCSFLHAETHPNSSEHYACTQPACQEQKFVVFPSAIDLAAHQIEVHGVTMGARERKDKMRVDAGFTFEDIRTGGRNARGQLAAPTSAPSAGASSSAGPSSRRMNFGGALTRDDEPSSTHADGLGYQMEESVNSSLIEISRLTLLIQFSAVTRSFAKS